MLWMYKNVYKIFKSEYILVQNYCSSKVNREVKHLTFLSNDGKRKWAVFYFNLVVFSTTPGAVIIAL